MNYTLSILINLVLLLISIQVIVSSAELLILRPLYRDEGLFSWKIQRTGRIISKYVERYRLDAICKYPNIIVVLAIRILCGMAIPLLLATNQSVIVPLIVITIINLILQIRNSQSNDGSDQMAMICCIALLLANLIDSALSWSIALIFIAAQSSLAYGVSGILKALKQEWHNGESVKRVLKTSSYGNQKALELTLNHSWLAKLFGYFVIYGDTILAFSFALPPTISSGFLFCGVCLHIGIGRVMGLNTFFWSYVSTYPAIFYVSTLIYSSF